MTEELTGWETTRLSKHFIALDFMADRAVYRSCMRLAFNEAWNDEHDALARGLCKRLLEPLMAAYGPVSVADAFWPESVAKAKWPQELRMGHHQANASRPDKHRWAGGEATVDIALYKLVDGGYTGAALKRAVEAVKTIGRYRDRVLYYPNTEFLCLTYKVEGAKKNRGGYISNKLQNLRAHHVRVGRYFNLLDFCRSGRAVEEGIDLVPKKAESGERAYRPVPEEAAARSFAAALDPLVEQLGRISVVRGMETAGFADDEHAKLHRWDRNGPRRLVFVLPQGTDPQMARDLLVRSPHVRDVTLSPHPTESWSLALVADRTRYEEYHGLRPLYSG